MASEPSWGGRLRPRLVYAYIKFYFAKDKDSVHYFSRTIKGADLATFQATVYSEAKDKNYTYKGSNKTAK